MNELAPYIKVINSIVYVNKMSPYSRTNYYKLAPYIKVINSIVYVNKMSLVALIITILM